MIDKELEFKLISIRNYVTWFKSSVHNINIIHDYEYEYYNEVLIYYKKDGMNYINKITTLNKDKNKNKLIYELLDRAIAESFKLIA